jgi:hypothetical protein
MRWDIAARTGVVIVAPCAAQIIGFFKHNKTVHSLAPQLGRHAKTAHASTKNNDLNGPGLHYRASADG